MKNKLLNAGLLLTSFLGYLEWGESNRAFLFQMEMEVLSQIFSDPDSFTHPFILIPLAGQLMLLYTLFQNNPQNWLTIAGTAGIGVLLMFMFVAGLMTSNYKITISTFPFLILGIITLRRLHLSRSDGN